jgi:hypothetical protein
LLLHTISGAPSPPPLPPPPLTILIATAGGPDEASFDELLDDLNKNQAKEVPAEELQSVITASTASER